jgi:hypothetical protein
MEVKPMGALIISYERERALTRLKPAECNDAQCNPGGPRTQLHQFEPKEMQSVFRINQQKTILPAGTCCPVRVRLAV